MVVVRPRSHATSHTTPTSGSSKDKGLVRQPTGEMKGLVRQGTGADLLISGRKARSMFVDFETMKMNISRNLCKHKYNAKDWYHTEGFAQAVARSWQFEYFGFSVIGFNALWVAIDTDYNKSSTLSESPIGFQIMEHSFCAYFFIEWMINFFAFESKTRAFKDWWMLFDTVLVSLMVAETWVLSILLLATGSSTRNGMKNASVLKLVRLLRVARVARIARVLAVVPELMILVKGMAQAMRSVCFTLCLLVGVIYVFGIGFVQLTEETFVGEKYFDSVAEAMLTLLLRGTYLDEITEIMDEMKEESIYLVILFLVFVLIAAQTLMNMLIGILCEVVSQVALVEKEEIKMDYAAQRLTTILEDLDIDNDMTISKNEFIKMMSNNDAVQALADVGVDAIRLVDFVDIIFADECDCDEALSYNAFINVVLQFRNSNPCTVKDLLEMQRTLRCAIKGVANYLKFMAEKSFGPDVKPVDISGAHIGKDQAFYSDSEDACSNPESISSPKSVHSPLARRAIPSMAEFSLMPHDDNETISNCSNNITTQTAKRLTKPEGGSVKVFDGAFCLDSSWRNSHSSDSKPSTMACKNMSQGQTNMQVILRQLAQEIDREVLQRIEIEGKTQQLKQEKDLLAKENDHLRELFKSYGSGITTAVDNTDNDSNATYDALVTQNQLASPSDTQLASNLPSRQIESPAPQPTTIDGNILEPPQPPCIPGAIAPVRIELGSPPAPTSQAPLMPLHAPLQHCTNLE